MGRPSARKSSDPPKGAWFDTIPPVSEVTSSSWLFVSAILLRYCVTTLLGFKSCKNAKTFYNHKSPSFGRHDGSDGEAVTDPCGLRCPLNCAGILQHVHGGITFASHHKLSYRSKIVDGFFNAISVLGSKRRSACLLALGYGPPNNTDMDPYRTHAPVWVRGRVLHPESAPNGGVL